MVRNCGKARNAMCAENHDNGIENLVELSFYQLKYEVENNYPLEYVTATYNNCIDAYQMLSFMGADPKVEFEEIEGVYQRYKRDKDGGGED